MDSYNDCVDKRHFLSYPYPVKYQFNSRGFRDQEWPDNIEELRNAIWCIGDSFTVGLGSPIQHTWPYVVGKHLNRRVINVSMDGGSNEWIARQTLNIINKISPKDVIIMWSYFQRRENQNSNDHDEKRRMLFARNFFEDTYNYNNDIDNFLSCLHKVERIKNCTHFIIPNAAPNINYLECLREIESAWQNIKGEDWPIPPPLSEEEYKQLPDHIRIEIKELHNAEEHLKKHFVRLKNCLEKQLDCNLTRYGGIVPQLDYARDGHHFDIQSSQWVADQVVRVWQKNQVD